MASELDLDRLSELVGNYKRVVQPGWRPTPEEIDDWFKFAAKLYQAAPALIAAAREAETLRALLRNLEWSWSDEGDKRCPVCWAYWTDQKHDPECRLAAAIA